MFDELVDRHADLLHGIAVADGDGVVFEGVEVNSYAVWGADFVLAAVTLADGTSDIIGNLEMLVEDGKDFFSLVFKFLG